MKPRPHQKQAIRSVLETLETTDRCQCIMACGTGKTLVGLQIAAQLRAKRILIAFPTLALVAQTLRVWRGEFPGSFDALCVCSDETVATDVGDLDEAQALADGVTTDAAEVGRFIQRRGPRVVFTTYQSMPVVANANGPRFDLILLDEAHRTAGAKDKAFGLVLDDAAVTGRKRVSLTATRKVFREDDLEDSYSMCDEAIYGPVAYELTFGEAIQKKLLADYRVVIATINESDYEARKTEIKDKHEVGAMVVVSKAIRKYDLRRVISFHSRVTRSARFASHINQVIKQLPRGSRPTSLAASHIDATTKAVDRHALMDAFANATGRALLSNARCLTEGVDIPAVDSVVFVDPKQSAIDITQAFGRAVRLDPDNKDKVGTIVLPVVIPEDADGSSALNRSQFKPVWRVLATLRNLDARLVEERLKAATGGSSEHVAVDGISPDSESDLDIAFFQRVETSIVGRNQWVTREEAVAYGVAHRLTNEGKWTQHTRGDPRFPRNPHKIYENGSDFFPDIRRVLGVEKDWVTREEAVAYGVAHRLTNDGKWSRHVRGDGRFPSHPGGVYENGEDFFPEIRRGLGIKEIERSWVTRDEAVAYGVEHRLTNGSSWYKHTKGDPHFPAHPDKSYENGEYFFPDIRRGLGVEKDWVTREEAVAYGIEHRLTRSVIWGMHIKGDPRFPSQPHKVYENGSDFFPDIRRGLGVEKDWVTREEAVAYGIEHRLTNGEKWGKHTKGDSRFPSFPDRSYENGEDFFPEIRRGLGIKEIERSWVTRDEAVAYGVEHRLTNSSKWYKYTKGDSRFPTQPHKSYENGDDFFPDIRRRIEEQEEEHD